MQQPVTSLSGGEKLLRDYRDFVGGGLLLIGGVAFSWYAFEHYDIGTPRQMGSGLFPAALGILLTFFALSILVTAPFRAGIAPPIPLRAPIFVVLSVAAFAALIESAGLIPAVVAVTVISAFTERKVRPLTTIVLCVVLSLTAWLIFRVGLGLFIPMFRWPF
jgi:hypothetical protein